jgi:hypothetical protein
MAETANLILQVLGLIVGVVCGLGSGMHVAATIQTWAILPGDLRLVRCGVGTASFAASSLGYWFAFGGAL